jgi:hypothetical protein
MTPPYFCDYLPFEENLALYLNNLESPLLKDDLNQVWLKLACWFWRRIFLKIFSVFLLFCYYLPLEKGNPLHINNLESPPPPPPPPQGWFVPIQVKIGPVVLEKKWKMLKFTDRRMDRRTTGDQYSSIELSAQWKVSWAKKINKHSECIASNTKSPTGYII